MALDIKPASDCEYAEVIVFPRSLSVAENEKVQTYLALKYGFTMPHNYTATIDELDITLFDIATYNNDITGIGRNDCYGQHQRASISINNPNSFQLYHGASFAGTYPTENTSTITDFNEDGMHVVVGHDNAATTLTTAFDGNANARMDRVWKVTETKSVGAVTVYLPKTYIGTLGDKVRLILSTDQTFESFAGR